MLFSRCIAVLILCWLPLVRSQSGSELQRGALRSPGVTVSVTSVRNQTGHWIAQVYFRSKDEPSSKSSTWSVDVEPSTTSCGGAKSMMGVKLTFTLSPPSAPPGYVLYPGVGFYKFHIDPVPWPRAKQVCEEEGGHLVIINSEEEDKVMIKLFAQNPTLTGTTSSDWAWIGARESESVKGEFFTIFGEPLANTGFLRWQGSQPDDVNSAGDYLLVYRGDGGLGDIPVANNWKQAYICEIDLC